MFVPVGGKRKVATAIDPRFHGYAGNHHCSRWARRIDEQPSAELRQASAHPRQADARSKMWRHSDSVVGYDEMGHDATANDPNGCARCFRMPVNVGERLLDHAVDGTFRSRTEEVRVASDFKRDRQFGATAETLDQEFERIS